jgi:hypothetical protein
MAKQLQQRNVFAILMCVSTGVVDSFFLLNAFSGKVMFFMLN